MSPERDAILRRRALFVASALTSTLGAPRSARAQDASCAPSLPPTAEALSSARERHQRAAELSRQGQFAQAESELERAYELSGKPALLLELALLAEQRQDYAAALRLLARWRECRDATDAAQLTQADALQSRAEGQVGKLVIRVPERERPLSIQLDGESLADSSLDVPIVVNAGAHEIVGERNGSITRLRVVVAPGDSVEVQVELGPVCELEPCVCLQPLPCLEPPLPPEPQAGFGVGAGYELWISPRQERETAHTFRAHGFYEAPLEPALALELGLEAAPTWGTRSRLFSVGGSLALKLTPYPVSAGLLLAGGYAFADAQDPAAGDSVVRSGAWLSPRVTPAIFLGRQLEVGLEAGWVLLNLADERGERFGLGFVSAGAVVRFHFEPRCKWDCDELEQMAQRRR